jgi:hypothetical protein
VAVNKSHKGGNVTTCQLSEYSAGAELCDRTATHTVTRRKGKAAEETFSMCSADAQRALQHKAGGPKGCAVMVAAARAD